MSWRSIRIQSQYFKQYFYVKRTSTPDDFGKNNNITEELVENELQLVAIRPNVGLVMDEGGNLIMEIMHVIVPKKWFIDNQISPSLNDFITKDDDKYRIIGIRRYDEGQRVDVYYLITKREKISA